MTADIVELEPNAAARLVAVADMLDALIRLHDREADVELFDGLRDAQVAAWFKELLSSREGQEAAGLFGSALEALPSPMTESALDDLAAEFADIYLTHGYRVSPSGSVWLTEDHLERQMPMFEVRDWYAHYDITVPDWRVRADDHLVHELQFISFLCRLGTVVGATDAAKFLDRHVLCWVPAFCAQGRPRLHQTFYKASFDLTVLLLEELRDDLEAITGIEREEYLIKPATGNREQEQEVAFVPGVAESW